MKKKYHLKPTNKYEIKELYKHLEHHAHRISIWSKGMSEDEFEHFQVTGTQKNERESIFVVKRVGNYLERVKTPKIIDEESFFKILIGRKTYCGKAQICSHVEKSYFFKIIPPIYLFDRRSNYRLNSQKNISIRAKFNDIKFECLNVSGKSLCILANNNDISVFQNGKILGPLRFVINDNVFDIPFFKVISTRVIFAPSGEQTNHFMVVCHFWKLSKTTEQHITKTIDGHARQLFLK